MKMKIALVIILGLIPCAPVSAGQGWYLLLPPVTDAVWSKDPPLYELEDGRAA
jgi:hypothetical protein